MKKRKWSIALVALALLLAACAESGGDTTTTAGGSEEPTTTAGGGEEPTTTAGEAPAGETPYTELNAALAGDYAGTEVEIVAQWAPDTAEGDAFEANLQPFRDATGIDVVYNGTPEYETALQVRVDGGDAPDLAQIAQPGKMAQYAADGKLVNLSEWYNTEQLEADLVPGLYELGTSEGNLYGVFYKTDVKSIVWYPIAEFEENGYVPPTTWDELIALSDKIVADGNGSPWCISIESEAADGWVATDWMEDILLRTAPLETYTAWYNHDIAFNDPEVLEAAELMHQIWFTDGYAYGGPTYINQTFIGNTQDPMFDPAGPQCWMQKQAAWIPGFWGANKDTPDDPSAWPNKPGETVGFFYFPQIDEEFGEPVLGGGDMFVMFNDRPEVRALLEWLSTPEGAETWAKAGGFLAANKNVPVDWYTSYPHNELAGLVAGASAFGFDASDLMPAEVGAGTFWSEMVEWVAAEGEGTDAVFQSIEDSWPAS